jgi:Protein of unknown function (DUF3995)
MIAAVSWALTLVLAAIAGVHAYWALGGLWPGDSEEDLVRTVIGEPGRRRMPPVWMTIVVTILLAGIAAWPVFLSPLAADIGGKPLMLFGSAVLAVIFLLRGVAGYLPAWRRRHAAEPFARFDRTRYSPLCLVLAAGFLAVTLMEGGI